jgi:hypothetical protein
VKDKKDHFELLVGYFSGEATPEEKTYIEEWIGLSERNKLYARKIYDLQYTSDTLALMNEIDANAVFKKNKKKYF